MDKHGSRLNCFIATTDCTSPEKYFFENGFGRKIILFAIPSLGILFRCRADGKLLDLEFVALFSLTDFLKSSLPDYKSDSLRIHSSNPDFLFSAVRRDMTKLSPRFGAKLSQLCSAQDITFSYIRLANNQALKPTDQFPSIPPDRELRVKSPLIDRTRPQIRPIQKGVRT